MFEFADHTAAIETAEAVLKELMNVENLDEGDIDSQQIEDIWNGIEERPESATFSNDSDSLQSTASNRTLSEKMDQPISRRQLLRGALLLDDDTN